MAITFYDYPMAPSPRRARILLSEKNVPYQTVEIDLRTEQQLTDEYKAINPGCTVPAPVSYTHLTLPTTPYV